MNGEHDEIDVDRMTPREIVRDEDVLSLELQQQLESVGTALGVIAAIALVASQISRARGLLRASGSRSAAPAASTSRGASHG